MGFKPVPSGLYLFLCFESLFSHSTPHSSNAKHLQLLQVWFVWLIRSLNPSSNIFISSSPNSNKKLCALLQQCLQVLAPWFQAISWHFFQCPFSIPSLVWHLTVKLTQFFRSFSCSFIHVETLPWIGKFFGVEIGCVPVPGGAAIYGGHCHSQEWLFCHLYPTALSP